MYLQHFIYGVTTEISIKMDISGEKDAIYAMLLKKKKFSTIKMHEA